MSNILAHRNRPVLQQFAWSNALLAFDFDGTLAPIAPEPGKAEMRSVTRQRLAALTAVYPCVVISGRSQSDVKRRLAGIHLRGLIGNHGVEQWQATREMLAEVNRWRTVLERRLLPYRGVRIEDKCHSIAVHYRMSRAKKAARAAILAAANELGPVRILRGKQVIDVLPEDAPHKGFAVEKARARLACDTAVYVGDDETDEDVFALDQPGRLLTIRVGAKRASLANYSLHDQREIDELLLVLLRLRSSGARGWRESA